jgi:DNA-binding transcriptional LysR family regulator
MDKLKGMRAFVAIVDNGSFVKGAEKLALSSSQVVRTLAMLETTLGVRLLNRTTRKLALTLEGKEYYLRCRKILSDIADAELVLDSHKAVPVGQLSLTAPVTFGKLHLAPLVNLWLKRFPQTSVNLILSDHITDMIEDGYDLALRIGKLESSTLIVKGLGYTRKVICASPQFIANYGMPKLPRDINQYSIIHFSGSSLTWNFAQELITVAPVLTTNNVDVALHAAISGVGLAQLMYYQVADAVHDGALIILLDEHEPALSPIQFVYPQNRMLLPRVRKFIDWSSPQLTSLLSQAY